MELFLDNAASWFVQCASDAWWSARRIMLRLGVVSVGGPTLGEQFQELASRWRDDLIIYGPLGRWACTWQSRPRRQRTALAACAAFVCGAMCLGAAWALFAVNTLGDVDSDRAVLESIVNRALREAALDNAGKVEANGVVLPSRVRAIGY